MCILDLNSTLLGSHKVAFIMYTTGECGVGGRGFCGGILKFFEGKGGDGKICKGRKLGEANYFRCH